MTNTRVKGRRLEHRAKALLTAQGFDCELSRPSSRFQTQNDLWGLYDVVGISATEIICVQVKANRWPRSHEMQAMTDWPCPPGVRREAWRFDDRTAEPRIRIIS